MSLKYPILANEPHSDRVKRLRTMLGISLNYLVVNHFLFGANCRRYYTLPSYSVLPYGRVKNVFHFTHLFSHLSSPFLLHYTCEGKRAPRDRYARKLYQWMLLSWRSTSTSCLHSTVYSITPRQKQGRH